MKDTTHTIQIATQQATNGQRPDGFQLAKRSTKLIDLGIIGDLTTHRAITRSRKIDRTEVAVASRKELGRIRVTIGTGRYPPYRQILP